MAASECFFTIEVDPKTIPTAQHKRMSTRGGKPVFYDSAQMKRAKTELLLRLKENSPTEPIRGPVKLSTMWMYHSDKHAERAYKTTRPDTDNVIKAFKDCMTRTGFWDDDSQVVYEITQKVWTKGPGMIVVLVEKL